MGPIPWGWGEGGVAGPVYIYIYNIGHRLL